MKRKFDQHSHIIRENYYGVDGKPIANKDGFASAKADYDSRGSLIASRCSVSTARQR